ncbi:MAG: HEAT repeat domain-containing protein [Candidatus Micrarchaeota archaeon]
MQTTQTNINKLVSLTFDESPDVRKNAARKLGEMDDPAALFALMELSYDKDISVKQVAQTLLDKRKSNEQEVMSFAEIFSSENHEQDISTPTTLDQENKRNRVLAPITKLFEKKLGKLRADAVKNKMMPTIEKVYMKTTANMHQDSENGRKAIQEFLTGYMEAISDLDSFTATDTTTPAETGYQTDKDLQEQIEQHLGQPKQLRLEEEIGSLTTEQKNVSLVANEIENIEKKDSEELQAKQMYASAPQSVFQRAYETMLASGGDDKLMQREMKRLTKESEQDVKLAYNLARDKFKEIKITNLTKIKNGMRNINTELLNVLEVQNITYPKGKEKKEAVRLKVVDEDENEAIVFMFDDRGKWIQKGMNIKITRGFAKTFDFSKETAITVSSKGNIDIIL